MKTRQVASPFPVARPYTVPAAFARAAKEPVGQTRHAQIGAQVRVLRLAKGVSGGQLSASCGVSRSMLSRIERGLVSPSVETLARIASGLGVPVSRFFGMEASRAGFSIVRAGKGITVDRPGTAAGAQHELLGHLLTGNLVVEPYKVTVTHGSAAALSATAPGLKFVYVISGRMTFRYDAKKFDLHTGDALLFEAGVSHGFEGSATDPFVCLSLRFALREPHRGLA